jgi:DNA-directed RNA polymerase specialized sigma24 family protein
MTEILDYKNYEKMEELVLMAQAGDQEAFAKVYDALIDPIYRYVYYRANKIDVEDLVENVFLKVWENLKKYRSMKNKSFSSWVFVKSL